MKELSGTIADFPSERIDEVVEDNVAAIDELAALRNRKTS